MSEKITFDGDIQPKFKKYVGCMIKQRNLDLSKYLTVRSNASLIYDLISIIPPSKVQRMPPDEYLGDDFVDKFKKWMDTGFTES